MTLMAKLTWRLLSDNQSLWAQILTKKYVRGELSIKKPRIKQGVSNSCRGIMSSIDLLNKGIKMTAYNGREILFWRDIWVGDTQLINLERKELTWVESFRRV